LELAVKEVQRQFLDGWVTESLYAHRVCYTKERQEEEKIQHKNERLENIRANKKNANNFRKKQATKNQETLAVSIILGLALGIIVGGLGGGISHLVFGFGTSWRSAALLGFCSVSILTVVAVWIFRFFE
jgi:F0F1-type ATP synthase assembly protein I